MYSHVYDNTSIVEIPSLDEGCFDLRACLMHKMLLLVDLFFWELLSPSVTISP